MTEDASGPLFHRPRVVTAVLVAVALVAFLPRIDWGLPRATAPHRVQPWVTDSLLPLKPLAEMHNTFVVSKPDRQYGYPWFHYFLLAAADAPFLGLEVVQNDLDLEAEIGTWPFGFTDPEESLEGLSLLGRIVSLLMTLGAALATAAFARTLFGAGTALPAGLLTLLNPLVLFYGVTGNLEAPATFWTALGLLVYARILQRGSTVRRFAWLGVLAGVAMGTKDQAVVIFLPLALLLLVPRFATAPEGVSRSRMLLAGLGASVVSYLAATGMLVDPARHLRHVELMLTAEDQVSSAAAYWPGADSGFGASLGLAGQALLRLLLVFGPPVVVAAGLGFAAAIRRDRRHLGLLLPLPVLFLALYRTTGLVIVRYLMPLTIILDAFAAFAAHRWAAGRPRLRIAALALMIGWRLCVGFDLAWAQWHETRTEATSWLEREVKAGERIGFFGAAFKMPCLPAHIESGPVAGREEWEGQFDHGPAVAAHLRSGKGPEFLAILPDWTSPPDLPRSQDCPEMIFEGLERGSLGYQRVAVFTPPKLLPEPLSRPDFDSQMIAPPIAIYARDDVAKRFAERPR